MTFFFDHTAIPTKDRLIGGRTVSDIIATMERHGFRAPDPAIVALLLADRLGAKVLPVHGMVATDDGLECDCMAYERKRAAKEDRPVASCQAPGKRPRGGEWQKKATSRMRTILRWIDRYPNGNFGMLTGSGSGIFVVDCDGDTGIEGLKWIEATIGALPPTVRTLTGSGNGLHLWFRLPSGLIVSNSVKSIAEGVDIRGENGQIVLPGSLHKSGRRYSFAPGCAPNEVPLADPPPALVQMILEASKPSTTAKPRNTTTKTDHAPRVHDARSLRIGDGPGRGGFHGPIYRNAVKFFATAGFDADAEPLKAALKTAIRNAPTDDHDPSEIERYASDAYLDEEIANARRYIQQQEEDAMD